MQLIINSKRKCTMCGGEFEAEAVLVKDGDLCPECRTKFGGMAFLKCIRCNKIVSRMAPGMYPNGHLVKPGDLLHIDVCPVCSPGLKESKIEEFQK